MIHDMTQTTHVFDNIRKIRAMAFMVLVLFLISSSYAFSAPCKTGECQYYRAEKSHKAFLKDTKAQKRRDRWMDVIDEYRKVAEIEPDGPFAAVGLYKTGTLYMGLYEVSKNKKDQARARDYFEKASRFKKSKVRFEAEQLLKSLPEPPGQKTRAEEPVKPDKKGVTAKTAEKDGGRTPKKSAAVEKKDTKKKEEPVKEPVREPVKKDNRDAAARDGKKAGLKPDPTFPPEGSKTVDLKKVVEPVRKPSPNAVPVKGLRFGSLPTRTRIVIDTEKPVTFKHGILKGDKDPSARTLFVDLKKSTLHGAPQSELSIDDERVKLLRASEGDHDTVRLLVETKTFKDYKVFALRSPSRVVIDVWGQSSSADPDEDHDQDEPVSPKAGTIINASDLAKQFQLGVKRIVIDPGHGGQDAGAPGFEKGVHEKDVVLALSKKLAERIEKELGVEVIMTRSDDTFITLEERTQIANKKKADLFISIHTNASLNKQAYGIETYFLNLAQDKDSVAVAARENATSEKNISDLQSILDSLMRNTKITESSKLATYVQESLVRNLGKSYDHINNKGVKQAPFYVLLGARMPAILVETSFISNERECKRLTDAEYQDRICDAIVDGVRAYVRKTSPIKDSKKK